MTYPNVYATQTGPLALSSLDANFLYAVDIANGALSATAGGTADAITATYSPAPAALVAGLTLYVRAASANATTTPQFSPNGLTGKVIVKNNNQALAVGDIAGAGHWLHLVYDTTNGVWELMNPATFIGAVQTGGTANGVAYLNASKVLTTGTALTFDGTNFATTGTATATKLIPTGTSVTGNGLYLPAANALGLSTNGTNAVYIDSSQNVGIGTTSPSTTLSLKGSFGGGCIKAETTGTLTSTGYNFFAFYDPSGQAGYIGYGGAANSFDIVNNLASGFLAFKTGASYTERMRIDSSGNLLVGTTISTPVSGLALKGLAFGSDFTTGTAIGINTTNTSGTSYFLGFARGQTICGSISSNGANSTSYNTSSDYRLKNTITPMTGALAKIGLLKPCTYKWNADNLHGEGFIAHELQEVVPDCVTGEKDAVDKEGNPKYQGVDTSFLVATLTAAIQELKALTDTQASTITALTARITALENK